MSLFFSILVIILLFISNHINSTNHFIDSNECLLDIAILAFGHSYDNEIISSLYSNECEIENIFWITEMTYNSTILETDLNIKRVKIVRENIETKGYTTLEPHFMISANKEKVIIIIIFLKCLNIN